LDGDESVTLLLARPTSTDAQLDQQQQKQSPPALLAPLGTDGWIAVELLLHGGKIDRGALRNLRPALDCLRTSLAVVGRERAAGARARASLRGLLRKVGGWMCEGGMDV
jgi:hypothetical protein